MDAATPSSHLLSLALGSGRLAVPVTALGASTLLNLAVSDQCNALLVTELLVAEPPLAVWVACQLPKPVATPTLEQLGDFLRESWFQLNWKDSFDEGDSADHRRGPQLAERAVWVAERARELAEAGPLADEAFLLGLLHIGPSLGASPSQQTSLHSDAGQSHGPPSLTRSDWPTWLRPAAGVPSPDEQLMAGWRLVARAARDWNDEQTRTSHRFPELDRLRERWAVSARSPVPLARVMAALGESRLLRTQFDQQLEKAKLASLKELAYGASHEINNPLANIATRAQALLPDETDPERRRKLATINSQAFRAHEMISDMMLFAKPPKLRRETTDVAKLLKTVVGELDKEAELQDTRLEYTAATEPLFADLDPTHVGAALKALSINSLEALGGGGSISIRVQADDTEVRLYVTDTGPGIPPEVRAHLFDPFFSGREAGRGLGFGLSKCWRVVTEHGGRVDVESDEQGTTFCLVLPCRVDLPQRRQAS